MESDYGQIMICTSQTRAKILPVCIFFLLIVKGPNGNNFPNNVITSFVYIVIILNIIIIKNSLTRTYFYTCRRVDIYKQLIVSLNFLFLFELPFFFYLDYYGELHHLLDSAYAGAMAVIRRKTLIYD